MAAEQVIPGAMSVEGFSRWAGIPRTKVFEEIRTGRLEAKKCGRRTLITHESGVTWMQALPTKKVG